MSYHRTVFSRCTLSFVNGINSWPRFPNTVLSLIAHRSLDSGYYSLIYQAHPALLYPESISVYMTMVHRFVYLAWITGSALYFPLFWKNSVSLMLMLNITANSWGLVIISSFRAALGMQSIPGDLSTFLWSYSLLHLVCLFVADFAYTPKNKQEARVDFYTETR